MVNRRKRKASKAIKAPVSKRIRKNVPVTRAVARRKRVVRRRSTRRPRVIRGGEYYRTRRVVGRKRPYTTRKLSRLAMSYRILRFQGMRPFERGAAADQIPGYWWCSTVNSGVSPDIIVDLPCYVFCLNATRHSSAVGKVGGLRLQYDGLNHTYKWHYGNSNQFQGMAGDGTNRTDSYAEEMSTAFSTWNGRFLENVWYDIRIMLHNATQQPTVFYIDIVQFTQDFYDPMRLTANPVDTVTEVKDRNALYERLVRRLVSHPLVPTHYSKYGLRVLKSMTVTMKPNTTIDADTSPNHREVRLFYRDGVVNDYMWATDPTTAVDMQGSRIFTNPNVFKSFTPAAAHGHPAPRGRKYLMIRALDPTTTGTAPLGDWVTTIGGVNTDASEGPQRTPSFDLVIRKAERFAL